MNGKTFMFVVPLHSLLQIPYWFSDMFKMTVLIIFLGWISTLNDNHLNKVQLVEVDGKFIRFSGNCSLNLMVLDKKLGNHQTIHPEWIMNACSKPCGSRQG